MYAREKFELKDHRNPMNLSFHKIILFHDTANSVYSLKRHEYFL